MTSKKPRELKAIEKGEQLFSSQIQRVKQLSDEVVDDREIKKMKMIESLFLKKEREDERKKQLKERRELRKNMLSDAQATINPDSSSQNNEANQSSRKRRGGRRGRRFAARSYRKRSASDLQNEDE